MEQVIYRKYRPQSFAQIQGQPHVVDVLRQSIKSDKLAHAYIFSGPRGTGKTTTARIFSKAVNCLNFNKIGDVCNECLMCKAFDAGTNIDLIEIDAASNRGIEEIRQLKESINFTPTQGKYKIYIIDEVHMLTKEAFNALLKTLEEPPKHVVFIMATTEAYKVPHTILSRVQRFDFRLASLEEISAKLKMILEQESLKAKPEVLKVIYDYAEGSYRDAESLLGKIISDLDSKELSLDRVNSLLGIPDSLEVQKFIDSLLAKDRSKALTVLDRLEQSGTNWPQFTKEVVTQLRKQLLELATQSKSYSLELELLKKSMQIFTDIKQISTPKLLWEMICLELGQQSLSDILKPEAPIQPSPKPKQERAPAVAEPLPEEPIEEEVRENFEPTAPKANLNINLNSIKDIWPSVVNSIRAKNQRLAMLLSGTVLELTEDKLIIKTKFKYNFGVLNQLEHKRLVKEAIGKDNNLTVEVLLVSDLPDMQVYNQNETTASNIDLVESLF